LKLTRCRDDFIAMKRAINFCSTVSYIDSAWCNVASTEYRLTQAP
jgi:hypothetical protein